MEYFGMFLFVICVVVLLFAALNWPLPEMSWRDKEIHRRYDRMKKEEEDGDPGAAARGIAAAYISGLIDNQPNRDAIRRLETNWKDEE